MLSKKPYNFPSFVLKLKRKFWIPVFTGMTILIARFFVIPAEAGIHSLSMILDFQLFHE